MKKFIFIILCFVFIGCSVVDGGGVSSEIRHYVSLLDNQIYVGRLFKKIDGIDIPVEHYFEDYALILNGNELEILNYNNELVYKQYLNQKEIEFLDKFLNKK
jgi:hypothetical protein